jgi:outer membrane protein assembly factor BamB
MRVTLILLVLALPALASEDPEVRTPRLLWKTPLRSNSFGGGAVADVDGDGRLEIAFATYFGDSAVRVVNGEDGSPVWTWQGVNECLDASVRFVDLDGDGKLELVVPVSNSSHVHAFDAATGKLRWTYKAGHGECIDTPPLIDDVTGDGDLEVVVGTFKGKLHVMRGKDGKGLRTFRVAPGTVQSGATLMDLDGDGVRDFVAANFRGDHKVHAISGKDGASLWTVQTGNHMYHGCSTGDLDGDGVPDLTIGSYDGCVYAIRAKDGHVLWRVATGDTYIMSPTVHVDLDGDGKQEVVSVSQRVTAIDATGEVRWQSPVVSARSHLGAVRGASVADLDGDGGPDLAVVAQNGLFRVFRGTDGKVIY